jgi:hypothetical protein
MASTGNASVPTFAYVGCYTTRQRNGHGEGIRVHRIDPQSGAWSPVQLVQELDNPSWLILDRQQRFLYSAHGDGEIVTAFRVDEATGQLTRLGTQATKGKNGVRLGIDGTNKYVVVANYSSGTIGALPIRADGSLGPITHLPELQGKPGPHRTQQESSHPHDIVFDPAGRFLVVPDKGLDAVFVFKLDAWSRAAARRLPPDEAIRLRHQRARFDDHDVPLRRRARRADAAADHHHGAAQLHRQQHHVRDCRGEVRTLPLRIQSRPRQPRDLRDRRRGRHAEPGGLGADAGQDPALLRDRAVRDVSLRSEPGQRHHRHVPCGSAQRQAHADRPRRQNGQPVVDRVPMIRRTP